MRARTYALTALTRSCTCAHTPQAQLESAQEGFQGSVTFTSALVSETRTCGHRDAPFLEEREQVLPIHQGPRLALFP